MNSGTIKSYIKKYFKRRFTLSSFLIGLVSGMFLTIIIITGVIKMTPEYFGTVGEWIGAIGTLLAVGFSLYLSGQTKPHAHVCIKLRAIMDKSNKLKIGLRLLNDGTVPLEVQSLQYTLFYGSSKDARYQFKELHANDGPKSPIILSGEPVRYQTKIPVVAGEIPRQVHVRIKLTNGYLHISKCKVTR